jgi:hypothetical protein
LERKNPFGPEEKTVPSRRNPVLEARPGRAAVAVVEMPTTPPAQVSQTRPAFSPTRAELARAEAKTIRLTDDTAGPSTPRPRLSFETVPRIVADASFIRCLPLDPRDAFLLAHLDGENDLRTLVDITGMTRLEVSMILEKLVDLGVIQVA